MSTLNRLMNYSAQLADSKSFFKGGVAPRLFMVTGVAPLEALLTVHQAIKLPFELSLFCVKIPAKVCSILVSSKNLKEFADSLPGPSKIFKTALKIVGYALGSVFTLTLGAISPRQNFRLHCKLSLVHDMKAEAEHQRIESERIKERQAYEKQIQSYVQGIVESLREKNTAEERRLANELAKIAPKPAEPPQPAPIPHSPSPEQVMSAPHPASAAGYDEILENEEENLFTSPIKSAA